MIPIATRLSYQGRGINEKQKENNYRGYRPDDIEELLHQIEDSFFPHHIRRELPWCCLGISGVGKFSCYDLLSNVNSNKSVSLHDGRITDRSM